MYFCFSLDKHLSKAITSVMLESVKSLTCHGLRRSVSLCLITHATFFILFSYSLSQTPSPVKYEFRKQTPEGFFYDSIKTQIISSPDKMPCQADDNLVRM